MSKSAVALNVRLVGDALVQTSHVIDVLCY